VKGLPSFDDTDKGLFQPQPRQAVGFDDLVKSDFCRFPVLQSLDKSWAMAYNKRETPVFQFIKKGMYWFRRGS